MTNLQQAAVEYKQALINLKHATDSRGARIMLGPTSGPLDFDNPLKLKSKMPAARDYGVYLKDFVRHVAPSSEFVSFEQEANKRHRLANESNFARNCKLLAAAWEAAARYEELKGHE